MYRLIRKNISKEEKDKIMEDITEYVSVGIMKKNKSDNLDKKSDLLY